MITFDEMAVLDVNAEFLGVPTSELMDHAGRAIADAVREMTPEGGRVVFLCGTGNNAGDGFVAARMLAQEAPEPAGGRADGALDVRVVLARSAQATRTSLAREALNRLRQTGATIVEMDEVGPEGLAELLDGAALAVDAMVGVGLDGALREPYRTVVEVTAERGVPVLAVDLPTGLGTDLVLVPERTVTFHDVKEGMDEATCGEIRIADIGIPEEAEVFIGPGELVAFYPLPGPKSHKGDNGRMLTVGGGPYTGAPALAALGGLRIGADLSHLFVPERVFAPVASFSPDLIVHGYPGDRLALDDHGTERLDRLLDGVDACVVGPGLGKDPSVKEQLTIVFDRLRDHGTRVVLDAEAIAFVGAHPDAVDGLEGVVTPHRGEFAHLSDGGDEPAEDVGEDANRVAEAAGRLGLTVLRKGPLDLISDGKRVKVNRTGNARMTVGGTGDVLAGLCGGLLAKGMDPFDAACVAAFVNGYAGDLALQDLATGFTASDMLEYVPRVLVEFFDERGTTLGGGRMVPDASKVRDAAAARRSGGR